MLPHFFALLQEWGFLLQPGTVALYLMQVYKGVLDFQENIYSFQKDVLLAIPFFLLETKTQFSKYPRVPTWQHCLISMVRPHGGAIFNYKKSCYMKVKVHWKLPRFLSKYCSCENLIIFFYYLTDFKTKESSTINAVDKNLNMIVPNSWLVLQESVFQVF